MSFSQEGLWFLDRIQKSRSVYNVPVEIRLSGVLDVAALERSLGEIVRRHEALRTTLGEVAGAPVQVIAPFQGFTLPVLDLSALEADARAAEAERRIAAEGARRFDLAAGPLVRARLFRLEAEEHVLLVTMHHAVTDGWSVDVLYRELGALYAAFTEGRESPLAPLPVQFADYAAWERAVAESSRDRELAWWRAKLAGAPALLELPTDRPRPAVLTYRGARESVRFSAETAARIEALGRAGGASLYMVLLGAFQVLLGRYAGVDDVVVGSPIAGRTRRELHDLIGFFTRTLVLRTDLSGDPAFREVLRRVREVTLEAYEHQATPFDAVVQTLAPGRALSHAPVFQVMMVLQTGGPGPELPGLRATGRENHPQAAKLDLTLSFIRQADGVQADLEYSTDLFDRPTIVRMLAHLERLLEQACAHPDLPISRFELLGEEERETVVAGWNATAAPFPSDLCIHQRFEARVAETPEATALTFEGGSLTYAALNERANRLAHHLRARGIAADARVGVMMERGAEMVVSLLAILKAGAAYVPLDPGYPADRLAYMLADSAVSLVLTQEALRASVPPRDGVQVLAVDAAAELLAAQPGTNPACAAGPDSLAYVIYTSGSTGRPKGVMNPHRGVVNRLAWMQAEFGLGAGDVVLQKTPFSFDVSVWEFFWPLQEGARLVMARPGGHRDVAYLEETIEREGVTTLHFVPS
ncbi:MAG: AMP-binding protein, partial [Gemmatimonadetes bacterium]|nr:AMP-binding protein [Gemmatimonadota bacterium]